MTISETIPTIKRIKDQKDCELEQAKCSNAAKPETINDLIEESESMDLVLSLLRELENVSEASSNAGEGEQGELF